MGECSELPQKETLPARSRNGAVGWKPGIRTRFLRDLSDCSADAVQKFLISAHCAIPPSSDVRSYLVAIRALLTHPTSGLGCGINRELDYALNLSDTGSDLADARRKKGLPSVG
jgi:hypothetical protein